MKTSSVIIILTFLLGSCSRYPGYKHLNPEIYYSLIQFGDNNKRVFPGDYITVSLEYRTIRDSLFFSGTRKIRINKPEDRASVNHCFLRLNMGDSASFILPAAKFFGNTLKRALPDFINPSDPMVINTRLIDVQSEKEFQAEKQLFLKWTQELSEYESMVLRKFLLEEKPGIEHYREGFYMVSLKKGNARKVEKGSHIWVHYEGKFLNGHYFDGTYRPDEPVDFIYGTGFVLLPGLDQALAYMSEGEKCMVILPSGLAFGENGDESGIIPPYTSLIYTLEVLRIE